MGSTPLLAELGKYYTVDTKFGSHVVRVDARSGEQSTDGGWTRAHVSEEAKASAPAGNGERDETPISDCDSGFSEEQGTSVSEEMVQEAAPAADDGEPASPALGFDEQVAHTVEEATVSEQSPPSLAPARLPPVEQPTSISNEAAVVRLWDMQRDEWSRATAMLRRYTGDVGPALGKEEREELRNLVASLVNTLCV